MNSDAYHNQSGSSESTFGPLTFHNGPGNVDSNIEYPRLGDNSRLNAGADIFMPGKTPEVSQIPPENQRLNGSVDITVPSNESARNEPSVTTVITVPKKARNVKEADIQACGMCLTF